MSRALTSSIRLLLVLPPYIAAVWWTTLAGMNGDDALGLIAFLLVGAGLFVLVQATWLRGSLSPTGVFVWNPLVVTALGLAWGSVSAGEEAVGAAVGLVIGVLTGFVALWLGDLTQLRRRPRVFLSYRRSESGDVAHWLYERLAARYSRRNVFMDVQSLRPGRDFRAELRAVIKRCDAVVALIGPEWVDVRDDQGRRRLYHEGDYVRTELETALQADVPVVPVLLHHASLPAEDELPDSLRALPYLQGTSLRPGADFDRDFEALLERFEEALQLSTASAITAGPPTRYRRLKIAAFLVALLMPLGWTSLVALAADGRTFTDAALSPDGDRIASSHGVGFSAKASLRLCAISSGKLEAVRAYGGDGSVWSMQWSPDGRWLATGDHGGTLRIWDPESLRLVRELPGTQGVLDTLAWSLDSSKVATGDRHGTVRVWRVDTGALLASTPLFSEQVSTLAWSPSGEEIAAGSWDTRVMVLRLRSGRLHPSSTFEGHRSHVTRLAWSHDGTQLASGSLEAPLLVLHVLQPGSRAMRSIELQQVGSVSDLQWSRNGAWLASVGADETVRLFRPDGELRHILSLRQAFEPNLAWAPDSSAVASGDERAVRVWSVRHGEPIATLAGHRDQPVLMGWSPDGRELVSRNRFEDDDLRVWDVHEERSSVRCGMTVLEGLRNRF